ncbi:MAG TPA: discoidin domain-containing protein [Blastocatellia bacterium]|nr:discoidin domain-containing protein [Blastocatellia bacterium]
MFPRLTFTASATLITICLATVIPAQTYQARAVRPVSVTGDLNDITRANDERVDTRANAGTANYAGMSITLDLGGQHNIIGVTQDHGRWPTNYPGAYKVEVAENAEGPWMTTFQGAGQRGESRAVFEAVRGRLIRVTATDTHGGADDWSIAEVRGGIDPGATAPRRIPARALATEAAPRPRTEVAMRDINLAFDKDPSTRATTGKPDYAGVSFTFDLGGEYELSRVVQIHGQWPDDYPAEYQIDVSRERNENRFREVWRGAGQRERSIAEFAPIITRYVRIIALRARDNYHWWSIAELRTNRDREAVERDEEDKLVNREIRHINAQGLSNAPAVSDDNNTTRATTGAVNYAGSWITADLGGSYTVGKVIQVHDPDDRDFPGRYRIEVSEDGRNWRTVWTGQGERGRSVATFSPVRARFVRITAIANHDLQHWWSIYKLKIRG